MAVQLSTDLISGFKVAVCASLVGCASREAFRERLQAIGDPGAALRHEAPYPLEAELRLSPALAWSGDLAVAQALEVEGSAADLAAELASLAPGSMNMGLAAFVAQDAMAFDSALPYLRTQIDACLQSADAKEGISAFLEKREPNWD